MNIAQEKYFYKLIELSNADKLYITNNTLTPSSPEIRIQELRELFQMFDSVKNLKALLMKGYVEKSISTRMINEVACNTEENLHSMIEKDSAKYLQLLKNNDTSFYTNNNDRFDFLYFISVQYLRTNNVKQNMISTLHVPKAVNIEACWNVMKLFYATNMALELSCNITYKMILLTNNTPISFITSDQPVINTFSIDSLEMTAPSDIELYYPISPDKAVLISKDKEYNSVAGTSEKSISQDSVISFNDKMKKVSYNQTYARTSSEL